MVSVSAEDRDCDSTVQCSTDRDKGVTHQSELVQRYVSNTITLTLIPDSPKVSEPGGISNPLETTWILTWMPNIQLRLVAAASEDRTRNL
jgi:hypothetical protein